MKKWKEVPLPKLMEGLERDFRGLPVPFVVLKDDKGTHHFKINDNRKSLMCVTNKLCHICGRGLEIDNMWFIGGPGSSFDQHGVYIDGPVHKECGIYALQVCPYLAYSGYHGNIDLEKMSKETGYILYNPTLDQDRVPFFVFGRTEKYSISPNGYFFPERPFKNTEYWNNGEIIFDIQEVKNLLKNTKWEKYLEKIK